ncbi:hypothetical protein GIB67_015210 [Kingdonia uniflora]|uniref:Protein JASON n=1 Tax=Kingdonia uniflora TaxID=39325 RepID=A0A7J7MSS2_9MAGN|nr:hypothetical protein GIB67_015210 [Kingdonia uniflora]
MILRSLNRGLGFIFRSLMGCFFGCFRVKEDDHHRRTQSRFLSKAISSKTRDSLVGRRGIQSLFVSEADAEQRSLESPRCDRDDNELKEEAKFLKSCGTLLETPIEIRKASERGKDLSTDPGDSETTKFHSWLPTTSAKKLLWEEQPNPFSISPVKLNDELENEPGSWEHKSSREQRQEEKTPESSGFESPAADSVDSGTCSTVTPAVAEAVTTQQCKNKSVRFDCKPDVTYFSLEKSCSSGSDDVSKYSPYPTPLKLTDEMQTPGTVYPVNLENSTRIRSQYVYPLLNPVLDLLKWKTLKEDDYNSREQFDHLSENTSPNRTSLSDISNFVIKSEREATIFKEMTMDASLPERMKSSIDDTIQNPGKTSMGRDRPILGTVAKHCKGDEYFSIITPKWWRGNGIPNSTNKYKEDQKVSWHATPFEERLEKALTDETLVYERRIQPGRPIDFDDEENGTAISRLQPSDHPALLVPQKRYEIHQD